MEQSSPLPRPEPFTVHAEDDLLEDLLSRLRSAKWPDQDVPNDDWAYGSELSYIRGLVEYWINEFDWEEMEEYLNGGFGCGAEHFTLRLPEESGNPGAGLCMHYVHAVVGGGRRGVPLLLLHGWPGSFFEFHRLLPLLVEAGFDVVAPSLPGYGFSERPRARHFDSAAMARTCDLLMRSLGYSAYVAQGGDWGAVVTKNLGQLASAGRLHACKAIHVNMIIAPRPQQGGALEPGEAEALQKLQAFQARETGYQQIQGTKPQTLGFALADSPVGLLAWLVEKFRAWSDCGGEPERAISKDEMLTGVMLYWMSGCITSSMRLYYETLGTGAQGGEARELFAQPVTIPAGLARFPAEPFNAPKSWVRESFTRVVRDAELPRGGHFAAWEVPELLAEEVRLCFLGGGALDARALCGVEPRSRL
mmetsp:Transcript_106187/g.342554  ORF Transcript_106187/g.342554 Transcript_106187/m.342554 type:complete len:419 (-) Transcript_106187:80-1336(-)